MMSAVLSSLVQVPKGGIQCNILKIAETCARGHA